MRVIEHPFPLFLIGADILCGGKKGSSWNYTGFKLSTKPCGKVMGTVGFAEVMMVGVGHENRRIAPWHRLPRPVLCEKGVVWVAWPAPSWQGLFVPPKGECVGGLFMSLDETWASLPAQSVVCSNLKEWGIYDAALSDAKLQERWVRFHGVEFGVAPRGEWPGMRRQLLEVEDMLAARQHDVGFVGECPFDPCVPEDTLVILQPYPYEPEKWVWLRKEM